MITMLCDLEGTWQFHFTKKKKKKITQLKFQSKLINCLIHQVE